MFKVMTWNVENLFKPGAASGPPTQAIYDKKLFWFRDGALNQGLLTEQLCDAPEKGLYCPGGWVGQYLWGSADE